MRGAGGCPRLNLRGNQLSSPPEGVFAGLSPLSVLIAPQKRRGVPLLLFVSLEKSGDSGFKATVPSGAPFATTLPAIVTNLALPVQGGLEENLQPLIQNSSITSIPNGYPWAFPSGCVTCW